VGSASGSPGAAGSATVAVSPEAGGTTLAAVTGAAVGGTSGVELREAGAGPTAPIVSPGGPSAAGLPAERSVGSQSMASAAAPIVAPIPALIAKAGQPRPWPRLSGRKPIGVNS